MKFRPDNPDDPDPIAIGVQHAGPVCGARWRHVLQRRVVAAGHGAAHEHAGTIAITIAVPRTGS